MPNKENSMKKQFAEALKNRLLSASFDKITVTELAEDCGVNRQTFYYHFEDIYDLTAWCLRSEAESVIDLDETPFDWKKCVRALIKYIDDNHALCVAILNSVEHRLLRRILMDDIERLIRRVYDSCDIDERDKEAVEFNIFFYSMAVSGLIESWVLGEINISVDKLISYIENIIDKNAKQNQKTLAEPVKG